MWGGVAVYLRHDLTPTQIHKKSNQYCKVVCIYIPEINVSNITIYRPPKCPNSKFNEAIEWIDQWIADLQEQGITAIIMFNGDFNLPHMKGWDNDVVENLIETIEVRTASGATITDDKLQ